MSLRSVHIEQALRQEVLAVYQRLGHNQAYRGLFQAIVFPSHSDRDTGEPILAAATLAELEGKSHQVRSRNYRGKDFIARYQRDTGHYFTTRPHNYKEHRATTV